MYLCTYDTQKISLSKNRKIKQFPNMCSYPTCKEAYEIVNEEIKAHNSDNCLRYGQIKAPLEVNA